MDTGNLIYLLFFTIIFTIIFIILFIAYYRKAKKTYNQFLEKYRKELDNDCAESLARFHDAQEKVLVTSKEYEEGLQQLQQLLSEINEKEHFNQTLYKIREEELNNLIENKKKSELEKVEREVEEWAASAQEAAGFESAMYQQSLLSEVIKKKKELNELTSTINDYKARRDVINQEILRARAMEEQQDFYRIQLDDTSKEDIQVLNDIRQKLNKTDLLNKLIYENYIARPTKEMVKRVLEGKNPSGIYKVTNIKTNEIYIGKSTKISDRFQNHVKSACGLEGVAESQFQRALKKYGVDGFTWELLEEVPKENLSEREKYYIIFYGTKDYGYNQREG